MGTEYLISNFSRIVKVVTILSRSQLSEMSNEDDKIMYYLKCLNPEMNPSKFRSAKEF